MLKIAKVPEDDRKRLYELFAGRCTSITLEQFNMLIQDELPELFEKGGIFTKKVKEAFVFAYYHCQDEYPIVELLITDDHGYERTKKESPDRLLTGRAVYIG